MEECLKKKKKKKKRPIPHSIPKRPFPTFLLHVLHGYCLSLILFTNILLLTSTLLYMHAFSFLLYPYKLSTNFPQLSYYTTLILCYRATPPLFNSLFLFTVHTLHIYIIFTSLICSVLMNFCHCCIVCRIIQLSSILLHSYILPPFLTPCICCAYLYNVYLSNFLCTY